MKTLTLLAFMLVTNVFAGKFQEMMCDYKSLSLSYCINHYDRQCKAKDYTACDLLGRLHDEQEQYGKAKKYLEMVCDKANNKDMFSMRTSCLYLGRYYHDGLGVRQSYEKAFHYYKKGCDVKPNSGCYLILGIHYNNGDGVIKRNLSKAKELFGIACDLGSQEGCDYYKELKEEGY